MIFHRHECPDKKRRDFVIPAINGWARKTPIKEIVHLQCLNKKPEGLEYE